MFVITDYGFTNKVTKLTDADGELIAFDIVEGWVHIAPVSLKRTYSVIHGENFFNNFVGKLRFWEDSKYIIIYRSLGILNSLLYFDFLGRLAR